MKKLIIGGEMMNKDVVAQKAELVEEIYKNLTESQAAIVVEYRGLSVAKLSELRKLLRKEDRKTNSDRIIFNLAMMYDFNFKYSYKYIKENGILEKMFDLINKSEEFKPYFDHMDKYIEEGSKQYVRKKI